ncbi:MAG: DUF6498-containing protein [Patescibacteria group bacterium]
MNQRKKTILTDWSFWLLLLSNIITIEFAIKEQWTLLSVLWIYFFQTVVISCFSVIRIFSARNFSMDGIMINGIRLPDTPVAKNFLGVIVAFALLFEHIMYAIFLNIVHTPTPYWNEQYTPLVSVFSISFFLAGAAFFLSHLFSYVYHRFEHPQRKESMARLVGLPFARIVPLHLAVFSASYSSESSLISFLITKTIIDLLMHGFHHYWKPGQLSLTTGGSNE